MPICGPERNKTHQTYSDRQWEFILKFSDVLSFILEDTGDCSCGEPPVEKAMAIVRKIDGVKQQLLDLQNDLMQLKNVMKGDFALKLKKAEPALNIDLGRDSGCLVGGLGKTISVEPNIENMVWDIDSPDKTFVSQFDHDIDVTDIDSVVKAIINHYKNYGDNIGESLTGGGVTLIEGKRSTLIDLAEWKNACNLRTLLPSRGRR